MPQEAATATVAASLDSLLSPKAQTFDVNIRESVAESDFNDVVLEDDSRFSTVALSSRRSSSSAGSSVHTLDSPRPHSNSSTLESSFEAPKKPSHKKSASTTTIRSNHNLTFLLAKLEEDSTKRGSIDGQIKLQEGFVRLQKEKGDQTETENSNDAEVIDWDFWGAVMSDYQQFASEEPERLAQAIAKGIPGTLRGMMWQLMAASKDPELESTYLKLLKETSPHEKAITRDLGRTFPHHDFFTDGDGIGQENLFNVLKAYSLYDSQVGYCQGLPFVVAILLLNMPDEEAFSLLVRLMYVYDLRGHFLPEMPKLQLRLFQFDRLVEELLPVLHIHFLRQGVKSSMFCSQWFLTMFSYRFPLDVVFRIYDNCLANGIEAMFGFSIALLRKNEDLLLGLKFDEILTFLNTKLFDRYKVQSAECGDLHGVKYNADEFVNEAVSLRITPFQLDTYGHEYDDIMREANKHKVEMDELRTTNRNLSAKVKSLEADFAQLSTEHVELLNELVKARLQNEETESELVRYKLLYAEAMHQNEEGQSSNRISNSIASIFSRRGSSNV
ncbi:rab-GTPase-TBC domain-containing protein [Desarmillaria tabescens]|uniref:Rab-GTPase-TBC domain-containing protein n=1 Tax=Armillaria tabescens TaxID=1929756 RepID=A0AA39TNN0_ARMTA|nr:rab-GTPase-TBC domain-containing protein [Desarmillaria tabescens]KAK0461083.1 rab-GTPase-TBC domain-containing protein [Desarmillaria tabescens]